MIYNALDYLNQPNFIPTLLSLWFEREFSKEEIKLIEAIMIACIDHEGSPSSSAAQEAAESNQSLSQIVSSGVLTINSQHGGAIAPLIELLTTSADPEEIVSSHLKSSARIPGFGHRVYKDQDPRAQALISLSQDNNLSGQYLNKALGIEKELFAQKGKKLPINIDGAIAAICADLEIPAKKANVLFIFPRVAGLLWRGVR